jgi:hypothetical protein
MYTIFVSSFVVSSTCFGCYLHPPSGAQLQRTTIGFVWFGVLFHWSRYWFGTPLHLSTIIYRLTVLKCKGVLNQYLLQWNQTIQNLWLYAAVVLLMMGANSTRNM